MYYNLLSVPYSGLTKNLRFFVYKTEYLSNEIRKPIAITIEIYNHNIIVVNSIQEESSNIFHTRLRLAKSIERFHDLFLVNWICEKKTTIIMILYVNATTCRKIV